MRLIIFGPGHPYRGGIARTTSELAQVLVKRGHDVHFFTPKRQYPDWLFPGRVDRDPDACPRLDCATVILDPLNPLSWRTTVCTARRLQAEAWIMPYWTWAWAGLWRSLLGGERATTVAVVHNLVDHDATAVQRSAARMVLRRCDALFTHARFLEDRLRTSGYVQPMASHPLPFTGVGPLPDKASSCAAIGLPAGRRVALFLGLIRPYKGVDALLEAMATLPPENDWTLLVAGEPWGSAGREIEDRVAGSDLASRVNLRLGWVPEQEVPTLLAAADLVVLPYRAGSQSAVAPLALGAGLPVLSTNIGGLPELVRDGVDGLLVEPGSVDALAGAFIELDPQRLATLTEGARAGRHRLTWDGYAEALEGLLAQVIT